MAAEEKDEEEKKRLKRVFREVLESGPTDPRIMKRLDILEELEAAVARKDQSAMLEAGRKLAANVKELEALKTERKATMGAMVQEAETEPDLDRRTAKLVAAFEHCAKIGAQSRDEVSDEEGEKLAVQYKYDIAQFLDAMPGGRRSALAVLLDNPHPGVRASAGQKLLEVMPERVIPLLQEIEKNEFGTSAGWTAFWALSPDHHAD